MTQKPMHGSRGRRNNPSEKDRPPVRPARTVAGRAKSSLILAVATGAALALWFWPKSAPELVERPSPERELYGQHYDPVKYEDCMQNPRKYSPGDCRKFDLKREPAPETWPYPNVPPINWPEPPQRAQYRKGMTGDEYFKELCEKEAGEFIYRTVEDVEGLYMIRPRPKLNSAALNDRYALEDPYGSGGGDDLPWAPWTFVGITDRALHRYQANPYSFFKYLYLETPLVPIDFGDRGLSRKYYDPSIFREPPSWASSQVFYGNTGESNTLKKGFTRRALSRFGFTWRDVRRPFDRELGIGGGEVAVVDLMTNELLGVRRGFQRGVAVKEPSFDFVWGGAVCPRYHHLSGYRGRDKEGDAVLWFLTRVAKPKLGYRYELREE